MFDLRWLQSRAPWAVALTLALSFVALSASTAQAQELDDVIHSRTLDNGLEIVVVEDSTVPLVTIELTVRYGAFAEPAEYDGLAHLYEHMFFKGNDSIPNQEAYLERMRELGIVFNGTTSTERVNYFFTLPTTNLEPGLEFMYDATTTPRFDEEEFEKEKQVVQGEADRAQSNPGYWLRRSVNALLWRDYPHRKDPLGQMETVQNATVQQMQSIIDTYYVPNNSVLMIAGDVEPEAAFAVAEAQFGQWERGPDPFEVEPVPEHPALEETAVTIVEEEVQVPSYQFSWHGPSVDDDPEGTYAADVLLYILSQPASQFQQNLVDSRIALSAGNSYFTQRNIGPIAVYGQAQSQQLREAIRATLEEVKKWADPDYFTEDQLEAAKTILRVNDIYSREKTSSFASTLTFWWAIDDLDYYMNFLDNIDDVTGEDIAAYVEEYILGEPFVLGVLLSPQHQEELGLSEEELQEMIAEVWDEMDSAPQENASQQEGAQ